jgi:hypothetical protein
MATLTATGNSKHATLVANTVDVLTMDKAYPLLEVINDDATNGIYVTVDSGPTGSQTTLTPTVGGDGCWYVGPGGARVLTDDNWAGPAATPTSVIRLISAGAAAYHVTGLTKPND